MPLSFADAIFWIAVALCAVAEVAIVRSAFASRPAPTAEHVPAARRPVEALWAIVPAIALVVVLLATWRAIHPASDGTAAAATRGGTDAAAIPVSR